MSAPKHAHPRAFVEEVLGYFYPVHYQLGMEFERAMSLDRIDRKQSAMIWLIHSRGGDGDWVSRKSLEADLSRWFEISNSKITRMMRSLADEPLALLELAEAPNSAREKVVRLTPAGCRFVTEMIGAATDMLQRQLGHVSPEELMSGLAFFQKAFNRVSEKRVT
jgi:DNA-binding MarR family transcriptional regulator